MLPLACSDAGWASPTAEPQWVSLKTTASFGLDRLGLVLLTVRARYAPFLRTQVFCFVFSYACIIRILYEAGTRSHRGSIWKFSRHSTGAQRGHQDYVGVRVRMRGGDNRVGALLEVRRYKKLRVSTRG